MFHFRLEQRDGTGAAGVVRQMMQQFPNDLEPIYYGLKLSLLSARRPTYDGFRNLATAKGMSPDLIRLTDLCFSVVSSQQQEALTRLFEIRETSSATRFLHPVLEYLIHDIFGDDDQRSRRAKKVLLDCVDGFTLQALSIPP